MTVPTLPALRLTPRGEVIDTIAGPVRSEAPDVSVVAVSWNTANCLPAALDALAAGVAPYRHETVVVDNGSTDNSVAVLEARTDAHVVGLPTNTGFTHAANRGAALAQGRYLLFLNPDAVAAEGSIARLIDTLDARTDAWAATARFLNPDGSPQAFWRRELTAPALFFCYTHRGRRLERVLFRGALYRRHTLAALAHTALVVPLGAAGAACLLVRRTEFVDAGGFDERFFNFFQDTDLYRRMRRSGRLLLGAGDATVTHTLGVTFRQLPPIEVHGQFLHALRQYLAGDRWDRRLVGTAALWLEGLRPGDDGRVLRGWINRPRDSPL